MMPIQPWSKLCVNAGVILVFGVLLALQGCTAYSNSSGGGGNPGYNAPTAPSGLTATASSSTQVTLTWMASAGALGISGYRIERCTGANCSSFAQIATTSGATTFTDIGLSASTSYSYRVRAVDTAGNLSGYSSVSTATTSGASPTAPSNLVATASSTSQIGLSWIASTDALGISNYLIERCSGAGCSSFAQIASISGTLTTYTDSALTASTSYSYRVRATDSASNTSGYSNAAMAVTQTPPTAPSNLMATASSTSQIGLSWTASTDALGIKNYLIERCSGAGCSSFTQIASISGTTTTYSDIGLTASASYSYRVRTVDTPGNVSAYSNVVTAVTQAPPTAPSNLTATASSISQIGLSWTASTGALGISNYLIERCSGASCSSFTQIASISGALTAYTDSGLTASTSYTYRVRATDSATNMSTYSNVATAVTQTLPTAPSNLTATASSISQIGLSWTASTDALGIKNYLIERCSGAGCSSFAQIASISGTTTTYTDTGLTAATSYSYRVRAVDTPGNVSAYSNVATAVAQTPPTAPSNLAATAVSSSQINLTWTASTDALGIKNYLIERCSGAGCSSFAQIASISGTTTTYSDTGLTASASYSYRVRAVDTPGNVSAYSNVATAVAQTPPTAPSNLAATAVSSSQINLTWTASTDILGIKNYLIERCSGSGCNSFTQIASISGTLTAYSDTGLAASTSYSYRVRAMDTAGNISNYSNTVSAMTSSSGGSSITVSVSPKRGGITKWQTQTLTATLTGDTTNAGATWSATDGGWFSPNPSTTGVPVTYTPKGTAGLVTITATSLADSTKSATATIGVTDLSGVTTYLNGNMRQGPNTQEFALATSGPTSVTAAGNFGKLFSCTVDAAIYAQPLWVANLTVNSGTHNVIFVATQHDTVYALDADSSPCTTLWTASLIDTAHGAASGETWVTSGNVGCWDLAPDIGIVGTPVIDLATNTLYAVAKSNSSGTFRQRLHALDITSGAEKSSGPTTISATVAGTGSGSSGGKISFDALRNNQRPALLLVNGHVIITWASHCDNGPYTGWVMSYSASSLAQEAVFNTAPNGINSGVWMSGNGPAADGSGNIYFAIGNGTFDANSSGVDYGDAIIKLGPPTPSVVSPPGVFPVLSYFRSSTLVSPDYGDTDQGSGGALLLPTVGGHNYLTQAGKDGNIYVLNQSSLGGLGDGSNAAQFLSGAAPGGMWSSPTYWNSNVYFGPALDGGSGAQLRAFSVDSVSGLLSSTPASLTTNIFNFPGPTAPISSSGTTNGIVWALDNSQWSSSCSSTSTCQALHAYDATNLATVLYTNSGTNTGSGAVKFAVPTVANGKVYVGGQNTLTVYGLLP